MCSVLCVFAVDCYVQSSVNQLFLCDFVTYVLNRQRRILSM